MNRTWTHVMAAACGLLAVGAVLADDPYAGYVNLTKSDPIDEGDSYRMGASSFWNVGGWSDGRAPHADANYYVAPGQDVIFVYANKAYPLSTNVWQGGELALAGRLVTEVNWDPKYAPVVPNLTLLGGGEVLMRAWGPFAKNYGSSSSRVTVRSTRANPAVISSHLQSTGNFYHDINVPFVGDEDSALVLTRPLVNYKKKSLGAQGIFRFSDDATFAGFYGTLIFRGTNVRTDTMGVCGPSVPNGTLRIENDAQVVVHNGLTLSPRTLSVKNFELDSGALVISHGANSYFPTLCVTNSLSLGAKGSFRLILDAMNIRGLEPGETLTRFSQPLLHLSGKATESPVVDPGFKIDYTSIVIRTNDFAVGFLDNQDGSRDYCLYATDLVTMTNANVESSTKWVTQYGAFDGGHPQDFSDNQEPLSDTARHYVCTAKLCNFANVNLPLARLTVCANSSSKGGTLFRFKEINFTSGTSYGLWGNQASKAIVKSMEAERMRILPRSENAFRIYVYQDCVLNLNAPLEGSTPFVIDNIGWSGTVNLRGDNSDFHGALKICQTAETASHYPASPTAFRYQFKSTLSDARNFGGVYTGMNVNAAIEIANWPLITVAGDAVFTEPTRTMLISGGVKFDVVEGKSLVLSNQVAYAGHVVKDGSGVLELGGVARFGNGAAATAPTAGNNELEIAAGALKVSSETACDGLAISFAQGTRLIVPRSSEKGLYDVKWATPISVTAPNGKLPVEVELAENVEEGDVVICTVSAEAAENLSADTFVGVHMRNGYRLDPVRKRSNADGTVSYVANLWKSGFSVIVR